MNAAQKAWATRRARAATASPLPIMPPARQRRTVERVTALLAASAPGELTAGQKAAETRRAVDAARIEAEARRNGVEAVSPLANNAMVSLYVDDQKLGSGERSFLVLEIGQKTVRLFNAPTLSEIAVDRLAFDRHARPYRSLTKTVAAIIARNQATFERLDLDYAPRTAREAMRVLA